MLHFYLSDTVLPGEVIGEVAGFISGHGTYSQDGTNTIHSIFNLFHRFSSIFKG